MTYSSLSSLDILYVSLGFILFFTHCQHQMAHINQAFVKFAKTTIIKFIELCFYEMESLNKTQLYKQDTKEILLHYIHYIINNHSKSARWI